MPDHGFESLGAILGKRRVKNLIGGDALDETGYVEPIVCPRCRDHGYLRRDVPARDPDFGRPVECPCGLVGRRRQERIWAMSQVPATMRHFTLASFLEHPKNAGKAQLVADIREVWTATDRWPLLVGPVGLGKTGLAISLLMEEINAGRGGLYLVTPTFLARIRATYTGVNDGEVDEMDVLASVIETPLLVLDDLGKVALSEWGQEKLFTLVNERYAAGRRTIVTSNLDVEGEHTLEGHLWPATWDRLRGMSEVFRLTGESLR